MLLQAHNLASTASSIYPQRSSGSTTEVRCGGWPTFAFPAACARKKPAVPPFAVFESGIDAASTPEAWPGRGGSETQEGPSPRGRVIIPTFIIFHSPTL